LLTGPSFIHTLTITIDIDTSNTHHISRNIANALKIAFLGSQALRLSWRYLAASAVAEAITAAALASSSTHMR